jgi:hypothetical protein
MNASCSFSATDSSAHATTLAAGWRAAISRARLGPLTTATRSGPAPVSSVTISLIRRVVPSSMPFIKLTRTAQELSDPFHVDRFSRKVCEGTASTTISAPSAARAGSAVARTPAGSTIPGR